RWLIENRPRDSRGPQALANWRREQGRIEEAIALYREALSRNSNDAAAHLGLGTTLLNDRNAGAAAPHLYRATELLPREITAWTNLGSCLIVLGREHEALKVLEAASILAPHDPGVGINIGQAWLGLGNRQAADSAFNAVLATHPDHPAALHGL